LAFAVKPKLVPEAAPDRFLLPRERLADGLGAMGAKYLPTIKDLKATQRFQQKQKALPKLKKPPVGPAPKEEKKK
jgi:hypothetical protein